MGKQPNVEYAGASTIGLYINPYLYSEGLEQPEPLRNGYGVTDPIVSNETTLAIPFDGKNDGWVIRVGANYGLMGRVYEKFRYLFNSLSPGTYTNAGNPSVRNPYVPQYQEVLATIYLGNRPVNVDPQVSQGSTATVNNIFTAAGPNQLRG